MNKDTRDVLQGHINHLRQQSYPEKPEHHFLQKAEFVRGVIHGLRISGLLTGAEFFQALALVTSIVESFKQLKAA